MNQRTIVRSEFTREEVLDALRAKHPWIPDNHDVGIEATSDTSQVVPDDEGPNDHTVKTKARFLIEYTRITTMLALFLLLGASCAAPHSAWVAGGYRSAEVGLLAPVVGRLPALQLEASVERRVTEDTDCTGGKVKPHPLPPPPWGTAGGSKTHPKDKTCTTVEEDAIMARLGLRYSLADWAHVSAGINEQLGPFARLGVEKRLTPALSIGVDLLEDRGEVVLFGLKWSR